MLRIEYTYNSINNVYIIVRTRLTSDFFAGS